MKTLINISFLLLSSIYANSQVVIIDFGAGVIHLKYNNETKLVLKEDNTRPGRYKYEHAKIPFHRIVLRSQIGVSYRAPIAVKYYYQGTIFAGEDCLHGKIFGLIGEFGRSWKYLNAGVITGGYIRDKELWQEHYFKGGAFIPIVGLNLTMKKEFNRFGIELSNKITPLMTIHNVSLTYRL